MTTTPRNLVRIFGVTAAVLIASIVLLSHGRVWIAGALCFALLVGVAVWFRRHPPPPAGGGGDDGTGANAGVLGSDGS